MRGHEEGDSDEDAPLVARQRGRPRKRQQQQPKDLLRVHQRPRSAGAIDEKDGEDEISLAEMKARLGLSGQRDTSVASEAATSVGGSISRSSSSGSEDETASEPPRTRLRSKDPPVAPAPQQHQKRQKKRKRRRRKGLRGAQKRQQQQSATGSEFRPGWEEEVYRFKQSLRMPPSLINIPRPPRSASLPDLDQQRAMSPYTADSCSDLDSRSSWNPLPSSGVPAKQSPVNVSANNSVGTESADASSATTTPPSSTRTPGSGSSIVDVLTDRYKLQRKTRKRGAAEKVGSRLIPRPSSSGPELLPSPTVVLIREKDLSCSSSPLPSTGSSATVSKLSKKLKKGCVGGKREIKKSDETLANCVLPKAPPTDFHQAFRQNGGILGDRYATLVFKSRTRTESRVMRRRAVIREVFGVDEQRPASAPPVPGAGHSHERSAALIRSNKAVLNSKRRLVQGRVRNHDLLRVLAANKVSQTASASSEHEEQDKDAADETASTSCSQKRPKIRTVRRKFRSGFDYIRKKKKIQKRENGETEPPKDKKKAPIPRPSWQSVQDIMNEIKIWVINKGLGETVLHRASKLGYTDIVAFCLEKTDNPPSPEDNARYTPLHEACQRGHLDIARLLLMYGADVSASAWGGYRPLHEAAENGHVEVVRLLLSYGADPLLATYKGLTPLRLATDECCKRLLSEHLADVQGQSAPPWNFQGAASCTDPPHVGYDPLEEPPSPEPFTEDEAEIEFEVSEQVLPALYRLHGEPALERWVLLQDLAAVLRIKSRDTLLRQLSPDPTKPLPARALLREFKMADFLEQAKCCQLVGGGEKFNVRSSKVALVKYNDRVRQLLGVEKVFIR